MSRPFARSNALSQNQQQQRRPGEDDGSNHSLLHLPLQDLRIADDSDICPVCKSSRYLNPNMRFLVNPECYHKMCESCVDRIFSHGPAACPIAGCHRTLRKQRFRKQTFGDIRVEKEVDVRKRIAEIFNRRQEEFETLRDYNDYLEEIETVTFNLLNSVDVPATESKLAAYASQNAASITRNIALERQESLSQEAQYAAEREQAHLRREAARKEEDDERKEREEGRQEFLDQIAKGQGGDADRIAREAHKVQLKRSSARRTAAPAPVSQSHQSDPFSVSNVPGLVKNGSANGQQSFVIKGLKPVVPVEPEKPYDPFGGLNDEREYFVLQDTYEHPWLEQARNDPTIAAGGYDVQDYCARSLVEAFAGLGCFIDEEIGGRDKASTSTLATTAAAAASGGSS
ncbi:MAG: TFIIH/NER complex subunit [Chaenotheca gracillima]|nr:MAG: TFIIH/NER complex subunit [Chaenotheca gracillima]